MAILTKRRKLDILDGELRAIRQPYEPNWMEVRDLLLPYRHRIDLGDTNRGERRGSKIINSTAVEASNTLANGLAGQIVPSTEIWAKFTTPDPQLAEIGPVKWWLNILQSEFHRVVGESNAYLVWPTLFRDTAGYGTGAMSCEEDFESVFHCRNFLVGSYWLGTDHKNRANTFRRVYRTSVGQLVEKFGRRDPKTGAPDWSNFSMHVKKLWDDGQYNTMVDVCHVVTPNEQYDNSKYHSKYKRYSSCYYEIGDCESSKNYLEKGEKELFLLESGTDEFPFMIGRWGVAGDDVYGIDCPGINSLGDNKQLQFSERKIDKAVDKMIDPPMGAPDYLKGKEIWGTPGKVTYYSQRDGKPGIHPLYQFDPRVDQQTLRNERIEQRIKKAHFVDYFDMYENLEDRDRTAVEINSREAAKIVKLSPTLIQFNYGAINPFVDRVFIYMLRQQIIPPPPPELEGMRLKVVYVSRLAQAQRAIGLSSTERVVSIALQVAKVYPEVVDKIDWDQVIDEHADRAGAPPRIVVPDEVVAQRRAARAQAAAAERQAGVLEQVTKSAKTLSETDTEKKNALTDLLNADRRRRTA